MHIELLWLIPVVAFASFLFIVAYYAQKHAEERLKRNKLSSEVALYNAGHDHTPVQLVAGDTHDERLREMEKAINMVTESLANQQQSIKDIHKESGVYTNEINELKEKLRTVFKEYDVVLSENYSLRAKIKQLTKQMQERGIGASPDSALTTGGSASKPALHLYDDTRLINLATMDGEEGADAAAR